MNFNYFYGTEGEAFSYYMIPTIFFTDSKFKKLSSEAKLLYGIFLSRLNLSYKNKWIDEKNRIYIIFTVKEIMIALGKTNKTVINVLDELDSNKGGIGLIERKKQGLGKPNIIYVKNFMSVL